jgi:chemotaxis signal transduction protein
LFPRPARENAKVAVVGTEGGTAGVVVDSVEEVLTIAADQIEAVASGVPSTWTASRSSISACRSC